MNLHPAVCALLRPVSFVYGSVSRLRAGLYRRGFLSQKSLPQVVVSVGNLSVGGTGKTPMVLWIAERLISEGKRVGILSRGYRGQQSSNDAQPGQFSDEVRLLRDRTAGQVPIGVSADRFSAAVRLKNEGAEIDWFLLDDGFQHLQLARDIDIVLIDALDPFGGGFLPAGRLREPISALARADILVITRSVGTPALEEQLRRVSSAPLFYAQTRLESILQVPASSSAAVTLPAPGKTRFFSFCAIGNPAGFWSDLRERWGYHLVGTKAFRDHHAFSASDLREIERQAQAAGADALVCTEKDVYNLPPDRIGALPAFYCRIALQLKDPQRFWEAILETVKRRRTGGAR